MQSRYRISALLLLANWSLFFAVSAWISKTQGNVLWWLKLNWSGWLSDLGSVAHLGALPGGSVWIVWLILSVSLSVIYLMMKSPVEQPKTAEPIARKNLFANGDMMESRPELKEKILRLHESLDKI
ncbi:hypothetical protein MCEGEM3_01867 [Oxalobacteraceae bacterium]